MRTRSAPLSGEGCRTNSFRFRSCPRAAFPRTITAMKSVPQRWPRLVLTLPPDAYATLARLARSNLRDQRREALRLVLDGLEREASTGATR
jgi:hypothetical protein